MMVYVKKNSSITNDKENVNLFEIYSIERDNIYKETIIEDLDFSVRTYNVLKRIGCHSVWDILSLTEHQLYNIKNAGTKSIGEVINKVRSISSDSFPQRNFSLSDDSKTKFRRFDNSEIETIRDFIECILNNNSADFSQIDNNTKLSDYCKQILTSIDEVGVDICRIAYYKADKILPTLRVFSRFCAETDSAKEKIAAFHHSFRSIHSIWLTSTIEPILMAFEQDEDKRKVLLMKVQNAKTVRELQTLADDFVNDEQALYVFHRLCKFLKSDLNERLTKLSLELFNKENRRIVIECRAKGGTLEDVGQLLGVTRERVRQIETKVQQLFNKSNGRENYLWLISALLYDKRIIKRDDILTFLEVDEEIFCHLLFNSESPYYSYNRQLQALVIGDDKSGHVEKAIRSLPDIIHISDYDDTLLRINEEQSLPLDMLKSVFETRYRVIGSVYSKRRIPLAEMYEYVLLHLYPHGVKLFDHNETEIFKSHVLRIFGAVDLPKNSRAIDARIADIAVLCDRGTYTHPTNINLPDELLQKIDEFVTKSERISFSFLELFDEFQSDLLLYSNISNRYYLQGALKLRLSSKYRFARDYLSKADDFSIDEEVATFIKSRGEVSKDEIKATFAGMSEAMLLQIVARTKDIIGIDSGRFIHANLLDITDDDYELSKLIDDNIAEFPVSSRKMFEQISNLEPDFLYRNDINTHSKLFGVLRYMFEDNYRFSRPYIAQLENTDVGKADIIKARFGTADTLSVDELILFCEEHCLEYQSLSIFIRELEDTFLLFENDMLINVNVLNLTDTVLDEIHKLLIADIEVKGYLSAQKVDTYIYYPALGVPWTGWLLVAVAQKHFDDIGIFEFPTTNRNILNDVFVSASLEFDRYDEFLKWLVKSENTRSPFREFSEIRDWLESEGLINLKLPNFLMDYIYKDEYGKIITP